MKFFTAKYISLALLLASMSGTTQSAYYTDVNNECGARSCYECSCNPLYCGALDLQIHAGVVPVTWRHRGHISLVNTAESLDFLVDAVEIPKFKTFFRTPWTVGGQIGRALSDNTRLYLEFNYVQAKPKSDLSIGLDITPAVNVIPTLGKYRYYDFYVGARYYWDRWCDRLSFFLGGKIGFIHHKGVNFSGNLTACPAGSEPCPLLSMCTTNNIGCNRSTVFAGGGHLGLDVCFCGNWSFVVTAEVVANCGPENTRNFALGLTDSFNLGFASNLLIGHIGTELRFPITFGLRYSF